MTKEQLHINHSNSAEQSETSSHNSSDSPSNKIKSQRGLKFIVFLLFMAVIANVGGGYYLYIKYAQLQSETNISNDINNKVKQLIELNTADAQLLTSRIKSVENGVQNNQGMIQQVQESIKNIDNVNQNPSLFTKLNNIENLLNTADFKLKIDKDINTAKDFLKQAEQYLKTSKQSDLINLRKDIIKINQQLEQLNIPDEVKLIANLEQVSEILGQINSLNLMVNTQPEETTIQIVDKQVDSDNGSDKWAALTKFKNDLLGLVKIKQFDLSGNSISQMLSEDQIVSLKLLFKLNIEQAILDLKLKNYTAFNNDIDKLIVNTNIYLKNNQQMSQQILKLIEPLKAVEYPSDIPDLKPLLQNISSVMVSNT